MSSERKEKNLLLLQKDPRAVMARSEATIGGYFRGLNSLDK
jgi:hypothetical protein